ncbi:MAG: butyrate kinase [Bacteroidetes bacterium 4572_128]|nr:MAG: butyrate kinase [Bacteroidetes bacterium 4572_128]
MKDKITILAINPGSTSTKIAVYSNGQTVYLRNIKHSTEEINKFEFITDQYEFRKNIILNELKDADININFIDAIVGRGGLVKPIESGIYEVNEEMKKDLFVGILGKHASNLGGLIADDIAKSLPNTKAYIADPVVVDEFCELARVSGHPEFERKSIFHALNQKAIAKQYAKSTMKKYEDLNLIVAHLGGGISVGAHKKGRVIDVNQALNGEGPFSPERSGTLPVGDLVEMCFSKKYTKTEIKKMITGKGGFVAYFGTNDAYKIEQKAIDENDKKAKFYYDAMAFQIAKEIGAMSTVLKGEVDGILITGGLAHSKLLVNEIMKRVYKIAPKLHLKFNEN